MLKDAFSFPIHSPLTAYLTEIRIKVEVNTTDHDKEILCTRDKYPKIKIRTQSLTEDGPAGAAYWT